MVAPASRNWGWNCRVAKVKNKNNSEWNLQPPKPPKPAKHSKVENIDNRPKPPWIVGNLSFQQFGGTSGTAKTAETCEGCKHLQQRKPLKQIADNRQKRRSKSLATTKAADWVAFPAGFTWMARRRLDKEGSGRLMISPRRRCWKNYGLCWWLMGVWRGYALKASGDWPMSRSSWPPVARGVGLVFEAHPGCRCWPISSEFETRLVCEFGLNFSLKLRGTITADPTHRQQC